MIGLYSIQRRYCKRLILLHVLTTRVDNIFHENILLLKIDVERHEPQVIQGLSGLLRSKEVSVIVLH